MEFDKSRVYTALNAEELKIGSKVVVADTLRDLKERVEGGYVQTLTNIRDDDCINRFEVDSSSIYSIAYLISEPEPEEKKLKWTDLKVGDVVRDKKSGIELLITGIDRRECEIQHIRIGYSWISNESLEEWEKVE